MRLFVVIGLAVLVVACDGEGTEYPETYNCVDDHDHDDLLIGMTKTGEEGQLSFKLVDLVPAPPHRLENTWTVEIASLAGLPVDNASLDVDLYMRDHPHGSGVVTEITPMAVAGQYELDPVYLHMPGVWKVTIVESSDGNDVVEFRPCIPN